jgi:signal transduction histidine kinase
MQSAITLIDQTIQIARDISMELRPAILDHVGLHAAMQWQLKQFQSRAGIAVHFVESEDPPGLSRPCKIVLFRVLQEALTNVLRHAHASEVYVRLALEQAGVTLTIEDNGAGFDPQRVSGRSLGILGMRERLRSVGGQLDLSNMPARGARVVALVPVGAGDGTGEKENGWHAES